VGAKRFKKYYRTLQMMAIFFTLVLAGLLVVAPDIQDKKLKTQSNLYIKSTHVPDGAFK